MNKTRNLLFIIGCGISVIYLILIVLFDANVVERNLAGDGGSYLNAMYQLDYGHLHLIRPPGYPAFLLILKYISFTKSQHCLLIFATHFILWLFTILLLLKFFPKRGHWMWAALFFLLVINPSFVQYSHMILTEVLFLFLMILGFISLRYSFKNKKSIGVIGFVGCILFATLVRPGLFYFTLIAIGISLFYFIKKNHFIATGAIAALAIIFLALPMRVMKNTFGHYTISYIDKITQYRYLNARTESIIANKDLGIIMEKRDASINHKNDKSTLIKFISFVNFDNRQLITEHPLEYLNAFGQDLFENFHAGNEYLSNDIPIIGKNFYGLSRMLNMLFVIMLLVCLILFGFRFIKANNKSSFVFSAILLFYCFYSWFTSGVSFFQGDRFNVVWMPILVIFIYQFFNKANYEKG